MAYDLEEQESLAQIKAWWEKWGTLILSIVTVACLAVAGWRAWQWYQVKQATEAGGLYAMMIQANNSKDPSRVQNIAQRLHNDYSGTAYMALGALLAAYSAEENKQPQEAINNLEWIVGSDKYPELQTIAGVRLAGIYLDQGSYDKSLEILNKLKGADAQTTLIEDRKGDVYMAMGNRDKARESWEAALKAANVTNPIVRVIQIKLNAVL